MACCRKEHDDRVSERTDAKYSISETAKMIGIEQSVLRSTEKQLGLEIPRSEGNRRYYREAEVTLLKDVQRLREEGFTLRMIKLLLPKLTEVMDLKAEERRIIRLRMKKILADMQEDEEGEAVPVHKKEMPKQQLGRQAQRLRELTGTEEQEENLPAKLAQDKPSELFLENEQGYAVFGTVMTELLMQNNKALLDEMDLRIAQRIMKEMNYLFRERENMEEERYRKLDRTIREYQNARQQTAMEEERRGLFRRGFR